MTASARSRPAAPRRARTRRARPPAALARPRSRLPRRRARRCARGRTADVGRARNVRLDRPAPCRRAGSSRPRATRPRRSRRRKAPAAARPGLPATQGRAQLYEAELTLKVANLSAATKRALRLTRSLNGYVRSVEYGSAASAVPPRSSSGSRSGPSSRRSSTTPRSARSSTSTSRSPTSSHGSTAVSGSCRVSATGSRGCSRGSRARVSPTPTGPGSRASSPPPARRLTALQRQQAQLRRRASFATVSVALRTAAGAVVVPARPGRLGRAFDRAASILLDEARVAGLCAGRRRPVPGARRGGPRRGDAPAGAGPRRGSCLLDRLRRHAALDDERRLDQLDRRRSRPGHLLGRGRTRTGRCRGRGSTRPRGRGPRGAPR